MLEIITKSPEETRNIGFALGVMLKAGDVVCLSGDLGTGKTAFTAGIADGLGVDGYITSPTFTIVNEYEGRLPLYHFDVYRIADPEEMYEIGFEEYLEGKGVVVIEWAELVSGILPGDCIWVTISKDPAAGAGVRAVRLTAAGGSDSELEQQLAQALGADGRRQG